MPLNDVHASRAYTEFAREDIEQSIPARFAQMVDRYPQRLAIRSKGYELTYEALDREANRVAQAILGERGAGAEQVALLLENDAPMIISMLGVLKAGKTYVPLDPAVPRVRTQYILEDSGAGLIMTNAANVQHATGLAGDRMPIMRVDEVDAAIAAGNPGLLLSPAAPVWILYTSGSTGQPKGVVQTHRNINHFVMVYTNGYRISPDDRFALLYSFTSNAGGHEIFSGLLNGASVHPYDFRKEGLAGMADWLAEERITIYSSVPTLYRRFAESLAGDRSFADLRVIKMVGEPVYRRDFELFRRHFPRECTFINRLGSTETGTICWYFMDHDTEFDGINVPVGHATADNEIRVLGDGLEDVPVNDIGEIAVSGRYLCPGYWNKPELTDAVFFADPAGGDKRLYRTGDLGRMLADGRLVHVGRKDHQVKIRGYRIETAEIETALLDLAAVKEAVVLPHKTGADDPRLVAYYVPAPGEDPNVSTLRRALAQKLPEYMIPAAFVRMDSFPLAPNGKIARSALPEPGSERPVLETAFVAPRNDTERQVAEIWSAVLALDEVGIDDRFLELGGDSLKATQIISRILDLFQVEVPIEGLMRTPTVASMAALVTEQIACHGRRRTEALERLPPDSGGARPLSFAQQRMWILSHQENVASTYNNPLAFRIKGALDKSALTQALEALVTRQQALRTTIHLEDEFPVQVVSPVGTIDLVEFDISADEAGSLDEKIQRLVIQQIEIPFDLSRDLMLRASVFRRGPEDHVLLLVIHHIASDGWSFSIILRELGRLYSACVSGRAPDLPELHFQYADFAVWQRERVNGERIRQQLGYWQDRLAGAPAVLDLPTDHPRPPRQSYRGARRSIVLSESLSESIRALSHGQGCTLFMTLLAAFKTLLYRLTGQRDIIVGSPIAERNRRQFDHVVGVFLNTVALRSDLSANPVFRELLARVRDAALGAHANQEVPFEMLIEELQPERDLSRTPLVQVLFNMFNFPGIEFDMDGLEVAPVTVPTLTSIFDLTLYAKEERRRVRIDFVYNTDLFRHQRMTEMLAQYQHLLTQIVADPARRIDDYSLVTPAARALLPDPSLPLPDVTQPLVSDLIAAWAERAPRQTAVSQGERQWSYRELVERADAAAYALAAIGVARGAVVAIHAPRQFGLIVGMLAVLRSGGVFVLIDPLLPDARKQTLAREAGAEWLVSDATTSNTPSNAGWADGCDRIKGGIRIDGMTGRTVDEPAAGAADCRLPSVGGDDPCYIFFTSGSTGTPKGILGCHKGLSHFLRWQGETFDVGVGDRVAQVIGLSFDPILRDVFLPLTRGATLCLPPAPAGLNLDDPLVWLRDAAVTIVHTVPSLAQMWLAANDGKQRQPDLRLAFFSGEPLTDTLVRQWRATFPGAHVVNLYGPTETTMVKTWYPVPDEVPPGVQSLGRSMPQTQALVLDGTDRPCGINEPGEIVLRTPFRSLGYVNAPPETGQSFKANPFRDDPRDLLYYTGDLGCYRPDGTLTILGRMDDQVKVRGMRVEPGEISARLGEHPAVQANTVIAREDAHGQNQLIAYVVPAAGAKLSAADLRRYLSRTLTTAMVPTAYVTLERLPLLPTGKVDARRLPAPERARPELAHDFVAPRTQTEKTLALIWAEVLEVQRIGIHDNFFDLGGHSLLATQILVRVRTRTGVDLPLGAIFDAPTIAELAELIGANPGAR